MCEGSQSDEAGWMQTGARKIAQTDHEVDGGLRQLEVYVQLEGGGWVVKVGSWAAVQAEANSVQKSEILGMA
jgi:hypothetical protein